MEAQNTNNQLNEKKRPTAITVICVLGFIGAALIIPAIVVGVALTHVKEME